MGLLCLLTCLIYSLKRELTIHLSLPVQTTGSLVPRAGVPPAAARILRVLHDPLLARILPREASFSPQSVVLAVLSDALNPHGSTIDVEPMKHAMRGCGNLRAVAQVAAAQTRCLTDPTPTMQTVQGLWKLQRWVHVVLNTRGSYLKKAEGG